MNRFDGQCFFVIDCIMNFLKCKKIYEFFMRFVPINAGWI